MDKRTVKTSRFLVDDSWCCIEYEQDKVLEVREKSDLVPEDDCERCGSTLVVGERCTARYSDGDVDVAHMIFEADEKEQCIKFKLDEERKRKLEKSKGKEKKTQNAKPVSKDSKRKGNETHENTKKKRKPQETPKEKPLQEKSTNNQTQANTTSATRKKEIKELEKQQILAREKSAQELAYSMFTKINKHDTNSTACVSDLNDKQPTSPSLNGNQSPSLNCDQSLPQNSNKSESQPLNGNQSPSLNCDQSLPQNSNKSESQSLIGNQSSSLNSDQSLPQTSNKSESQSLNGNQSPSLNCDQSLPQNSKKSEPQPLNGNQFPYLSDQSAPSGSGDFFNPSIAKVPYQPIPQVHGFHNHFQHGIFSTDYVQPRDVVSQAQVTQHQNAFQPQLPIYPYPQFNYGPNYPFFNHSTMSPFTTNNVHGDNACIPTKDFSNVGKLMSSFNLLENENGMISSSSSSENNSSENVMHDDVDNNLYVACPISQPSDNELLKPQSPACDNQCLDCLKKDKEIADLKMRLYNLGPCEGEIFTKNKKYKPKTRPETKTGDYMIVPENSAPPAGFQLLAPEATIAVRPLWLDETVTLVGQNRDRQNKKAIKKGKKVKTNFNSEIIKKLMDGFFDPEELAVAGGTGAFKGNAIFESIKLYAHHCLSVDTATFHVYWREKMSSSSQTLERRRKNEKQDTTENQTESSN